MADLTLDLSVLKPREASFSLAGFKIEGGRPLTGAPPDENDITGGGFWRLRYGKIVLGSAASHRAWNQVAFHSLSAANRYIVPFQTDVIDPTTTAELDSAADLHDATIDILVTSGAAIQAGQIFSISHTTRGHRCYGVTAVDAVVGNVYTVGIAPPLREATSDATACDFSRPRCLMRLAPGVELAWQPYDNFTAEQSLELIEATWSL